MNTTLRLATSTDPTGRTIPVKTELYAVTIHNFCENYEKSQEGGTGIIASGTISGWVTESGSHRIWLGIWFG